MRDEFEAMGRYELVRRIAEDIEGPLHRRLVDAHRRMRTLGDRAETLKRDLSRKDPWTVRADLEKGRYGRMRPRQVNAGERGSPRPAGVKDSEEAWTRLQQVHPLSRGHLMDARELRLELRISVLEKELFEQSNLSPDISDRVRQVRGDVQQAIQGVGDVSVLERAYAREQERVVDQVGRLYGDSVGAKAAFLERVDAVGFEAAVTDVERSKGRVLGYLKADEGIKDRLKEVIHHRTWSEAEVLREKIEKVSRALEQRRKMDVLHDALHVRTSRVGLGQAAVRARAGQVEKMKKLRRRYVGVRVHRLRRAALRHARFVRAGIQGRAVRESARHLAKLAQGLGRGVTLKYLVPSKLQVLRQVYRQVAGVSESL